MENTTDFKAILQKFADCAKQNLEESKDHSLMPVALVVNKFKDGQPDDIMGCGLAWRNSNEKRAMLKQVSEMCRLNDPDGLVLIVDAHFKSLPKEADISGYRDGDLAKEGAKEAVLASWVGPRVPHGMAIMMPYHKEGDKVVWEEPTEIPAGSTEFGMLPAWWEA